MMSALDNLLNRVTMYRLLLYVLIGLLTFGMAEGFLGQLHVNGWSVIGSSLWIVGLCWVANRILAWGFDAPVHDISAYLTGLILALIISPYAGSRDIPLYIWAPILAMASKYMIALNRQHVFNPAAFGVALTAIAINGSASWWVGNAWLLPFVAIGGYLVVRKIRRWNVVWAFLGSAAIMTTLMALVRQADLITTWKHLLLDSPLFFFAAIMLTEPWTMPPTRPYRIAYGALIGLLFVPQVHLGSLYSTPELALLAGNFVFFLIISRPRVVLTLKEKIQLSPTVIDYVFESETPLKFTAGQYMEWTMEHGQADQRGIRRYFTLASAPTEPDIRMGVKFYQPASSFKQSLLNMQPGETIVAGQLDGDFTLPNNPSTPLAFIAGGIGITPFRSMIKSLLDRQDRRDIVLFYAAQTKPDFVYHELFDQAEIELGVRTVYVLGDEHQVPTGWAGAVGRMTPELIQQQAPDYARRTFYLSGPEGMVQTYKRVLRQLGVPARHIKTDYFPGFA